MKKLMGLVCTMLMLSSLQAQDFKRYEVEIGVTYGKLGDVVDKDKYMNVGGVFSYKVIRHLGLGVGIGWTNIRAYGIDGGNKLHRDYSMGSIVADVRTSWPVIKNIVSLDGVIQYGLLISGDDNYWHGDRGYSGLLSPQVGFRFYFAQKWPSLSVRAVYNRVFAGQMNDMFGFVAGIVF